MFSLTSTGLLPLDVPSIATILSILLVGVHSGDAPKGCNIDDVEKLLKTPLPSNGVLSKKYPNRCKAGLDLTLTKERDIYKLEYLLCKKDEWIVKMRMPDDMYEHKLKEYLEIPKDGYLSCEKKEVQTKDPPYENCRTLKWLHEDYLKVQKNVKVQAIAVALIIPIIVIIIQIWYLFGCRCTKGKLMMKKNKKKQRVEAENQEELVRDSKKETVVEPVDIDNKTQGETMVG